MDIGPKAVKDKPPRSSEPDKLRPIPYYEGIQERVPNANEIIHQSLTGRPMAWRVTDEWGNGEWRYVEWAS